MAKGFQCDNCQAWFIGDPPKSATAFETGPLIPESELKQREGVDYQVWATLEITLEDYGRQTYWCESCVHGFWRRTAQAFLKKEMQNDS